jgi:heat shock protein HslJ
VSPGRRLGWRALVPAMALLACAAPEPSSRSGIAEASAPDLEATFRAHLGRTWELARMGEQDIPAPAGDRRPSRPGHHPGPGSRPTIRFTAEPTSESGVHPPGMRSAGGWSFCNGYGTAYELGPGGTLRFHGFQSTLVGCDGPDSLETRFFRGLHETRRIELDSARLALVAENGTRLTFVLVANSVDPAVR